MTGRDPMQRNMIAPHAQRGFSRRPLIVIGLIVALAPLSVFAAGPVPTRGADWPAFLGPTADSKSTETGILTKWPADGPPLVWQLDLGSGYCMPAIAAGRLYQFDRSGDDARLRCLDSRTAKLLWTFTYPSAFQDLYGYDNGPRSAPVVNEGRVYIFGAEGMLHCLDAASGKQIWKVDTAADFGVIQNFFGVGSTPVIEGNLLLVQVGGSPPESKSAPPGQLDLVESNGTCIVAFDKKTGAVRYKLGDQLASYATPKLATIAGRRWCFVFARGGLLGFDPSAGKVDFFFPWRAGILESVNAADPVVVNDLVFISEMLRTRRGAAAACAPARPRSCGVTPSAAATRRCKPIGTRPSTWTAIYTPPADATPRTLSCAALS